MAETIDPTDIAVRSHGAGQENGYRTGMLDAAEMVRKRALSIAETLSEGPTAPGAESLHYARNVLAALGIAISKAADAFPCRRCSECIGEKHHWMDSDLLSCKHCSAAVERCDGCADMPGVNVDEEGMHWCDDCLAHSGDDSTPDRYE